jgi:hypothetical protein
VNRLFYNRVYLSGPIDNANDFGRGWRNEIKERLRDLDLIFLDPCAKPMQAGHACEDLENHQRRLEQKKRGDFETISREMRLIRCIDLRLADLCDFSIVHLDKSIYSTGTHEEIALLNRRKVPILVHMEQGKTALPDWYWGTLPHQHVFSTWDELIAYIRHVASDPLPIDTYNRWRFLDYGMLYGMNAIPLTQGKVAIVSPEDHGFLSRFNWCASKHVHGRYYAERGTRAGNCYRRIKMERIVMQRMGVTVPRTHVIDHINSDSLDNRRENLRLATLAENRWNSPASRRSKTGVKGVSYDPAAKNYRAAINRQRKTIWQRRYPTLAAAAEGIAEARKRLEGEFAYGQQGQ